MLTKQALDYANLNPLKPDRRENRIHTVPEHQPKTILEEKSLPQPPMHQSSHQQKPSTRDKKVVQIRPVAGSGSYRVASSSTLPPPVSNQAQLLSKHRSPECSSHLQQQRHLKQGGQRSHSSNIKLTRKPDLDQSPLRFDGRRSFSGNNCRSNWDERFNALSQSLKDICGSPKTSPLFSRSVTAPLDIQAGKDHKHPRLPTSKSLLVPLAPQSQGSTKFKRSSDPYVRPKTMQKDTRSSYEISSLKEAPSVLRPSPLVILPSRSPAYRSNRSGVTFEDTQRSTLKGTNVFQPVAESIDIIKPNRSVERCEQNTESNILDFSVPNPAMITSCPDGIPQDLELPEYQTSFQEADHPTQLFHKPQQSISGLPPISPKCSFSLPGSSISSPGNSRIRANFTAKPKALMRRINSVFLETMNQPAFVIDPSFKKITVRHEESSKSLELELTRVLFSNLHENSSIRRNKRSSVNDRSTEMDAITYPVLSEFLYKVAIKPHKIALEDLYVQLIGERTLRVGKLEVVKTNSGLDGIDCFPPFESGGPGLSQTISATVLEEINLPNELLGWTCSMTDDRRWLTIREVFRSAPVDTPPPPPTSYLSSQSVSQPFVDYSSKSGRLISDRKQTVPILEYSSNCTARYQPIVVNHNNSSQLSIVLRIPDEFDQEDLMIKRLDQKVIIKGRRRSQTSGACPVVNSQPAQSSNALPVDGFRGVTFDLRRSPITIQSSCPILLTAGDVMASPTSGTAAEPAAAAVEPTVAESTVKVTLNEDNSEDNNSSSSCPTENSALQFVQPVLSRSLSSQSQMGEYVTYFNVTIPLPPTALGRTLGAYLTPHRNLVIYAALNQSKRRRLSV